ncbi:MAG: bifunctional 2-keto-4-hydroxyglutarate aldolase/2-keto-3-deoxy-6-phosphogluconate aldolase, partial [Peptococcaceae bacterium]|nr:bifunctional 2-keto-4-hydroxyglutarate aldolase/2-keto-3-deoxy-6-phosphogluconate aldolase [Peptococcaceae bacterium]
GADVVKLFPGSAVGPEYVKAVKGPLPHVQIIPTGGVNLANVAQWIKNGCLAVGVGGELTAGAKQGDFALVSATAQQFVAQVKQARQ